MHRNGHSLEDKQAWMRELQHPALSDPMSSSVDFQQKHYTVAEIGEMWSLSNDAVRKLFEGEPGVLVLGGSGSGGKRRYTTLRIPAPVVERVYRRMLTR
jgi:hypothetical protein